MPPRSEGKCKDVLEGGEEKKAGEAKVAEEASLVSQVLDLKGFLEEMEKEGGRLRLRPAVDALSAIFDQLREKNGLKLMDEAAADAFIKQLRR
ncbi:hypothetical protein LshimejAT787_1203330 [Lyophyllum shimeji]|uniref:Uncharacterized protein n=1 Tax=Lyophyllum shimeji TaxID=47721 RepID=A0A9P3PWP6_LYOSH|nr:hypothetical protein LshimejAT787_1203330 [Lyophyllum shimeji]